MADQQKPDLVQTSVMLPGDLWKAAKSVALNERCDLKDLIIEGLALVVDIRNGKAKVTRPSFIPKKESAGGAGVQISVQRKKGK